MGIRGLLTLVAVLLVVPVAACGTAAEQLERVAEQAEEVGDTENGSDEGSIQAESEGNGSSSAAGGELPEGFPLPVPDGGEVAAALASESESGTGYNVTVTYPADRYQELVEFYQQWLEDEGYDISRTEGSAGLESVTMFGDKPEGPLVVVSLPAPIENESFFNVGLAVEP